MELIYESTRNSEEKVTASQAVLKGLADGGGLFVPTHIPSLDIDFDELAKMDYQDTAFFVMRKFLTDFTEEELRSCISEAYDGKFDTKEIAPVVKKGDVVAKGDTIAAVGSPGRSTGNHLHFSVRLNGSYVSPWGYLKN